MNAVVTGATKGLGRAMAEMFASQGFNLCVCARTHQDLQEMKADFGLRFPSVSVHCFQADMSKKEETLAFGDFINNNFSSIDILVNNTGRFLPGQITSESDGILEEMINTNLYSAYYLTRSVLKNIRTDGKGYIFNICSIASFMAYPNGGSYSISKFALLGFSKVLREELKPSNIKVTAVMPGAAWSDSWKGVDLPRKRLMEAEDIAKTIWGIYQLSDSAVVEEIIIRPQLGDL